MKAFCVLALVLALAIPASAQCSSGSCGSSSMMHGGSMMMMQPQSITRVTRGPLTVFQAPAPQITVRTPGTLLRRPVETTIATAPPVTTVVQSGFNQQQLRAVHERIGGLEQKLDGLGRQLEAQQRAMDKLARSIEQPAPTPEPRREKQVAKYDVFGK